MRRVEHLFLPPYGTFWWEFTPEEPIIGGTLYDFRLINVKEANFYTQRRHFNRKGVEIWHLIPADLEILKF